MNPLPNHSAARAGAALGFLAMTLVGWKMADQSEPPSSAPPKEDVAKVANRPERHTRKSGPPDAVRQRMASLRAISSPADRMRATIEFANNLPVSEIAAWMDGRWFNTGEGFDLTLFDKILTERWKKEDPEGLLVWSLKNNSGRANEMLSKWAETDPQKVMDFFKAHPNKDLQLQSLAIIAKKNPAFALQCLRDSPVGAASEDSMGRYYYRQVLAELAKSAPAELEAAMASMPASLKSQAEIVLTGQKLQKSFSTEFQKLLERPDGWNLFYSNLSNDGGGLADKIFDQLANLPAAWKSSLASNAYSAINPSNATKWWNADLEGLGFSDSEAKRIRQVALTRIGRNQPEEAIKLMGTADLGSSSRRSFISNVFSNLKDGPDKAEKGEAMIALLGSEEDKQQARAILASNSDSQPKIEKPADWLEKVGEIDPKNGSSYQYLSMLRQWDPEKITELDKQFQTMPDDKKKQVAQAIVNSSHISSATHTLQGDAIRYLVSQPPPAESEKQTQRSNTIEQASEFAVNWSKSDPTAASAWVQTLPAGDAKVWAQRNLASNWAQYDPQAMQQWLKSLPANERTAVQDFMKKSGR